MFAALAATALVAAELRRRQRHRGHRRAPSLLALVVLPLLITPLRQRCVTAPLLRFYTKILPPLSDTERVALEAGTVGFEGELFSGTPEWDVLLSQPQAGADRRRAGLPRRPRAKKSAG